MVSVSIPESGREGCEALLQSSPWLSLHISNAKGYFWSSRHTQHHSKPLCVITDPQFLLGFHLFNLPVSSAFNTPSSVRGQKRSLYIQKDTSSLQQLLYLTKKIHGVVMATVLSKNRSAIYSTAQSTAELTEAALTAHWEMQADFCSLGGLVSSISHEITQPKLIKTSVSCRRSPPPFPSTQTLFHALQQLCSEGAVQGGSAGAAVQRCTACWPGCAAVPAGTEIHAEQGSPSGSPLLSELLTPSAQHC